MDGRTILLTNPPRAKKIRGKKEEKPRSRRRIPKPKVDVNVLAGAAAGGAGYAVVADRVVGMLGGKVPSHVARGALGLVLGFLASKQKNRAIQAAGMGAVGAAFSDVVRLIQGKGTYSLEQPDVALPSENGVYFPEITVEDLIRE